MLFKFYRTAINSNRKVNKNIPYLFYFALTSHCGYISFNKTSLNSVPPCEILPKKAKKDIDKIFKEKIGK